MSCIYNYNPRKKSDGPHALQEGGAVFNKPESGGRKWPAWLLAFVVVVGVLAMLVLARLSQATAKKALFRCCCDAVF